MSLISIYFLYIVTYIYLPFGYLITHATLVSTERKLNVIKTRSSFYSISLHKHFK